MRGGSLGGVQGCVVPEVDRSEQRRVAGGRLGPVPSDNGAAGVTGRAADGEHGSHVSWIRGPLDPAHPLDAQVLGADLASAGSAGEKAVVIHDERAGVTLRFEPAQHFREGRAAVGNS